MSDFEEIIKGQSYRIAENVIGHIDTMYPDMWKGVPKTARLSVRNTVFNLCRAALHETADYRTDTLQEKIDSLMLEYCPDEMTPDVGRYICNHDSTTSIFEKHPNSDFLFVCNECGMKKNSAGDWLRT